MKRRDTVDEPAVVSGAEMRSAEAKGKRRQQSLSQAGANRMRQRTLIEPWTGLEELEPPRESGYPSDANPESDISREHSPDVVGVLPVDTLFATAETAEGMDIDSDLDDPTSAAVQEMPMGSSQPEGRSNEPDGWLDSGDLQRVGHTNSFEVMRVPDANYLGYTDRRWLVSKKRTPVLADYVNKWRKSMLKVEAFSEDDRMIIDGDVDAWL